MPEQGTTIGYNLSCFPNIWQDTVVLGNDIKKSGTNSSPNSPIRPALWLQRVGCDSEPLGRWFQASGALPYFDRNCAGVSPDTTLKTLLK